ncbi:MAG: hypothetical protein OXS29_14955 [bacterium]|nr:hypothetical protein [bacterium]MDE0290003.1 hypothetical protein [bacterium]
MDWHETWWGQLAIIVGGGVILLLVSALARKGTAIRRNLQERRELVKEEKQLREKSELETEQLAKEQRKREEERQRYRQRFRSCPTTSWTFLPPETDAGQVIVGYLSDGHPHWKFMEERVCGEYVDLEFAVKATAMSKELVRHPEDEGNELEPGRRAARIFHSGAEVMQGSYVDDYVVFGSPLFGYVLVRIKVGIVPD